MLPPIHTPFSQFKVQRKDVRAHAKADMAMMEVLVRVVAKIFPEFRFLWLAEETKRNLPREMDFAMDGRNSERAARYFAKFSFLKVRTWRGGKRRKGRRGEGRRTGRGRGRRGRRERGEKEVG